MISLHSHTIQVHLPKMAKETKGVWNLEYRNLHAAAKMDWVRFYGF